MLQGQVPGHGAQAHRLQQQRRGVGAELRAAALGIGHSAKREAPDERIARAGVGSGANVRSWHAADRAVGLPAAARLV